MRRRNFDSRKRRSKFDNVAVQDKEKILKMDFV
jgi:hypothetical protein